MLDTEPGPTDHPTVHLWNADSMRRPPVGHGEALPRYLRIPQAAGYLGLAPKTLYKLTEEKRIPYIRRGRTIFFDRLALDKWMAEGSVNPLPVWG